LKCLPKSWHPLTWVRTIENNGDCSLPWDKVTELDQPLNLVWSGNYTILCMQSITIFSFEFSALIPLCYFYLKQYMLSSAILFIYLLSIHMSKSYVSMILVARVSLTNPMCLTWYVFFFFNLIWVTQLRYPFQFIRKSRSKTEISSGNFWWVIGDCINLATEIVHTVKWCLLE
jgi:hypothetical protein